MWRALGALGLTGCQLVFSRPDGGGGTTGEHNLAFVTSEQSNGNLGGLAGADLRCQAAADAEQLPGTYVAWLATREISATSRLDNARGWVRLDGQPIADRASDLSVRGPLTPLALTEGMLDIRGSMQSAFTGMLGNGASSPNDCLGWTTTTSGDGGTAGDPATGGGQFAEAFMFSDCAGSSRLYCLGIDRADPLVVPASNKPIAFVSNGTMNGSEGRARADAICAIDAADAGLTGVFLAALSTSLEAAAKRFPDREYVRADGIELGRLLSTVTPNTFLNVTATGTVINSSFEVWTGGAFGSVADAQGTCLDWTSSNDAIARGTTGLAYAADERNASHSASSLCSLANRVYCLRVD